MLIQNAQNWNWWDQCADLSPKLKGCWWWSVRSNHPTEVSHTWKSVWSKWRCSIPFQQRWNDCRVITVGAHFLWNIRFSFNLQRNSRALLIRTRLKICRSSAFRTVQTLWNVGRFWRHRTKTRRERLQTVSQSCWRGFPTSSRCLFTCSVGKVLPLPMFSFVINALYSKCSTLNKYYVTGFVVKRFSLWMSNTGSFWWSSSQPQSWYQWNNVSQSWSQCRHITLSHQCFLINVQKSTI